MANLSSKTGFTPVQTRITLSNNAATTVANFSSYDSQELTGFVYVDATTDYRAAVKVTIFKNGAGTYEIAISDVAGDLLSGAPIVSFSISSAGVLSATLPNFTGYSTAYIQYNLNAPINGQPISGITSSGSGSGEVNAITNSSAATDTSGWTNVTRVTSGSPLDPITTTAFSVSNTAAAESSTSGGYATISILATPLRSARLKVEFYYTTPATDVYRVSVYQGSTRLSLTTDSSGATTLPAGVTGGFFYAEFDTTTAAAYSVNITRTSGSTGACLFTAAIFGPGKRVQGASIGNPQSVAVTGSWVTNTTYTAFETRLGSLARYDIKVAVTGAPTSANLTINLPSGRTIDTTAMANSSSQAGNILPNSSVGIVDVSVESYAGGVYYISTTSVGALWTDDNAVGTKFLAVSATAPFTWASGDSITISFIVPIAEWAGNGTVNLGAGAQVEYCYFTGTVDADSTSAGTAVAYGPVGAQMSALTNLRSKYVLWQTPPQNGDLIFSQVSTDSGTSWSMDAYPFQDTGTGTTTVGVRYFSTSAAGVSRFQIGRYAQGGSTAWTSTDYVRFVKVKPSSPVGFGLAGTDTSGLIPKFSQGTYSFTPTTQTNLDASIASTTANYVQMGNVVTVFGTIAVDISAGSVATSFEVALPIASSLTNAYDIAGIMSANNSNSAQLTWVIKKGTTSSTSAKFEIGQATGSASLTYNYTFTYKIS